MIASFLLIPDAFGTSSIDCKAARQAAELLLTDILDGGVIIDYAGRPTLDEIENRVEHLRPELKQRLLILIEEMKKRKKTLVAVPANDQVRDMESLIRCLQPDAAVAPVDAADALAGLVETITVTDYIDSATRNLLVDFRSPQKPAAHMSSGEVGNLLGRFLKYTRSVAVIDKMIGRGAKGGSVKAKFVSGLQFVVDSWKRNSVYSQETLELVVVTVAGDCGAGGGYVDPQIVGPAICTALGRLPVMLKVVLKQDTPLGLFHARYLKARGRCCKLDPGIDALANGGAQCACLQIDPPCEATHAIAQDILKLPELEQGAK